MDAKLVIKDIMRKTGMSQEKLAEKSGMKGQTNVTGILNRSVSLRVDKLDQLISAMGYKIVIVPENVKVRDGWYEVGTTLGDMGESVLEKHVSEKNEKSKKGR